MDGIIIDKRPSGRSGGSHADAERFLRKARRIAEKAAQEYVKKVGISGGKNSDKVDVIVSQDELHKESLDKPRFRHGRGGKEESVHPGNVEYIKGDKIARPKKGAGGGQGAGKSGEGDEGGVAYTTTLEQLLDDMFDGLELPNRRRTLSPDNVEVAYRAAGISTTDVAVNLNVIRTMRQASARRRASGGRPRQEDIYIAEVEYQRLLESGLDENEPICVEEKRKIALLQQKRQCVPFIDYRDLKRRSKIEYPKPRDKIVMFCLEDTSGSMTAERRSATQWFFFLMRMFLKRKHPEKEFELIFIRHTTEAEVVSEEKFNKTDPSGGTKVSSGYELAAKVIHDNYAGPNIDVYVAHATDGDNGLNDNQSTVDGVQEIMNSPNLRYMTYFQIGDSSNKTLWDLLKSIEPNHGGFFAMDSAIDEKGVLPAFRRLYAPRGAHGSMRFDNNRQKVAALQLG